VYTIMRRRRDPGTRRNHCKIRNSQYRLVSLLVVRDEEDDKDITLSSFFFLGESRSRRRNHSVFHFRFRKSSSRFSGGCLLLLRGRHALRNLLLQASSSGSNLCGVGDHSLLLLLLLLLAATHAAAVSLMVATTTDLLFAAGCFCFICKLLERNPRGSCG